MKTLNINRVFFAGMFMMACIMSLIQDGIGQEDYTTFIRDQYWISEWISVPIALVCAVSCLHDLWTAKRLLPPIGGDVKISVTSNLHPSAGRFCHICGADSHQGESCDAGLHS